VRARIGTPVTESRNGESVSSADIEFALSLLSMNLRKSSGPSVFGCLSGVASEKRRSSLPAAKRRVDRLPALHRLDGRIQLEAIGYSVSYISF